MNNWIKIGICSLVFMSTLPLKPEMQDDTKIAVVQQSWSSFGKEKVRHAFLIANRFCDGDLFLAWPILAQMAGYDMEQAIDLFLKVNAARLLINVALHEFDQKDEALASLRAGFLYRMVNSFVQQWTTQTA